MGRIALKHPKHIIIKKGLRDVCFPGTSYLFLEYESILKVCEGTGSCEPYVNTFTSLTDPVVARWRTNILTFLPEACLDSPDGVKGGREEDQERLLYCSVPNSLACFLY